MMSNLIIFNNEVPNKTNSNNEYPNRINITSKAFLKQLFTFIMKIWYIKRPNNFVYNIIVMLLMHSIKITPT